MGVDVYSIETLCHVSDMRCIPFETAPALPHLLDFAVAIRKDGAKSDVNLQPLSELVDQVAKVALTNMRPNAQDV